MTTFRHNSGDGGAAAKGGGGVVGRAFAVIAGGGTAGHVIPALAIARALVDAGHPPEAIYMVGSERGIEAKMFPASGLPHSLLPGRGIERKISAQNVRSVGALGVALQRARKLVRDLRPEVVVAVGGYA